ncbi:MAG: right-handed parallel beta-helix repeat-containing protein [Oscillochloridaceae bacterium umkhey_bin13]
MTLSIRPGTTLRFERDIGLSVFGTLMARGTPGRPISFTSNQAAPAPGDWRGIEYAQDAGIAQFDSAGVYVGGSILQYSVVEYAGGGDFNEAAIDVFGVTLRRDLGAAYFDHVTVRGSSTAGIKARSGGLVVTNSTISQNARHGIEVADARGLVVLTGNLIEANGRERSGDEHGGIYLRGSDDATITVARNMVRRHINGSGVSLLFLTRSTATIDGNQIAENTNGSAGGGVQLSGDPESSFVASGNLIERNASPEGGAVFVDGRASLRISQSIIRNNTLRDGPFTQGQDGKPGSIMNNGAGANVDARDNYWGTTDTRAIAESIQDFSDARELGPVQFEPFLSASPAFVEPVPAPALVSIAVTVQPGSFVSYDGGGFPPDQMVALTRDDQSLGELRADASGMIRFTLATAGANEGSSTITASAGGLVVASAALILDANAPLLPQDGSAGTLIELPAVPPVAAPATAPCDAPALIQTSTTLSAAQCNPYLAPNGMVVMGGAVLTIDAGTTIKFGPNALLALDDGGLIARGTAERPVTFTSSAPAPAPGDWQGIAFGLSPQRANSAELYADPFELRYTVIEFAGGENTEGGLPGPLPPQPVSLYLMRNRNADLPAVLLEHLTIRESRGGLLCTGTGNLRILTSLFERNRGNAITCTRQGPDTIEIEDTTIRQNAGQALLFSNYATNIRSATLSGNTIYGNAAPYADAVVEISPASGDTQITGNLIYNNLGQAALLVKRSDAAVTITRNTIANNVGAGLNLSADQTMLTGNAIFGNLLDGQPRDLDWGDNTRADIQAPQNYWGVTSEAEIEARVVHRIDASDRGMVFFTPFLSAPPPDAPTLPADAVPPQEMAASATASVLAPTQAPATAPTDAPAASVTASVLAPTQAPATAPTDAPAASAGAEATTAPDLAPTQAVAQPDADAARGGTVVASPGLTAYLPWAYWGLLGLLGLLWGVEVTTRHRQVTAAIATVFSAGKGRVQQMKLTRDRADVEKQLAQALSDLGKQAWEQQVVHPAYSGLFEQIGGLVQQRTRLRADLTALDTQLQQVTITATQVKTDYSGRINSVQDQKKAATARINQSHTAIQAAEKQLGLLQARQQKTTAEIQGLRQRLDLLQSSQAPDRDTQVATLHSGIAALEQTLTEIVAKLPLAQAEIDRLQTAHAPLTTELATFDGQIGQLRQEQHQAVNPLEQQRAELQTQRNGVNDTLTGLMTQIDTALAELGAQVNLARPQSPALADTFARLDRIVSQQTDLSRATALLDARQASADRSAPRTVALLTVALLGTIGVVVWVVLRWPGM